MGLLGKAVKKTIGIGSSKNDVKIAKLELEKAKIENASAVKMEFISNLDSILSYTKKNFDTMEKTVMSMKEECVSNITKIEELDSILENTTNKSDIKATKKSRNNLFYETTDKLYYLYLAKDFFSIMAMHESHIAIKEEKVLLVNKFLPFFNGEPVLEEGYGTEEDEDDDSVLGAFKEVGKEIKEAFVSSSKENSKKLSRFSLTEYSYKYSDKVDALVLPPVDDAITAFLKAIDEDNYSNILTQSNRVVESSPQEIKCPTCNNLINSTAKFCPSCGSKIELPKKSFCSNCGNELNAGDIFCSNCGSKV